MRIPKGFKLLGAVAALAGLSFIGARKLDSKMDFTGTDIPVTLQSGEIDVPVYNMFTGLRPGRCSAYVRKAAKDLFNENYSFSNAWDRIYNDKVLTGLNDFESLEDLAKNGTMNPGNLVGVVYPNSPNMDGVDARNEPRQFSHLLLYLGDSPEGELLFSHRVGDQTHVDPLSHFKPNGYEAKYLIGTKN